ncbi:hypothetical protein FANTH_10853 [Fusarium anthophilum]|uniref:Uncharacterized protein n=1 Tax=Fusarium anthophilum TaxID=48485 RepID=A0A8H4Z0B0_9HYPO|nr:hypothetical protein FANTH_10853 [Fusarium anthophilum]
MMNQPKGAGRAGGTILQAFLVLFALTNFQTLTMNLVAACNYWPNQLGYFDSIVPGNYSLAQWISIADVDIPIFFLRDMYRVDSERPFLVLALVAGVTWIVTSITLLSLFTKIRYFNHRVARYVFRIIGVATSAFLVAFYSAYANSYNFIMPFVIDWPLGKTAVVIAHINLALGIFITLLAAALDTPKDWDTSTGPNSRLTSQA